MRGHGAKFSHKMEQAIAALLSQRNHEEAARVAGVGVATLLRWQKLPEFQAAYRQARREAVGQATARLQQASGRAGGPPPQNLGGVEAAPPPPGQGAPRVACR